MQFGWSPLVHQLPIPLVPLVILSYCAKRTNYNWYNCHLHVPHYYYYYYYTRIIITITINIRMVDNSSNVLYYFVTNQSYFYFLQKYFPYTTPSFSYPHLLFLWINRWVLYFSKNYKMNSCNRFFSQNSPRFFLFIASTSGLKIDRKNMVDIGKESNH